MQVMNPFDASEKKDINALYPEFQRTGSIGAALAEALASIGSPLTVKGKSNRTYARIELKSRFCQIYVASQQRLFMPDFWSRGVCMAGGGSADLSQVALAIHQWLSTPNQRVAEMANTFSWIKPAESASAFEDGRAVDYKWDKMLNDTRKPDYVHKMIEAAAREPRLRMLFPFLSLHSLHFSRCTGFPYTTDIPYIWPIDSKQYLVFVSQAIKGGQELGRGDLDFAIWLVLELMPSNIGPARDGTAEDLESDVFIIP
jgi:hypothetical protein